MFLTLGGWLRISGMRWLRIFGTQNIDIDDRLMRQAMRHSGARTKKATVEAGLRLLVDTHAQGAIRRLKGKVRWEGNLKESRQGRVRE